MLQMLSYILLFQLTSQGHPRMGTVAQRRVSQAGRVEAGAPHRGRNVVRSEDVWDSLSCLSQLEYKATGKQAEDETGDGDRRKLWKTAPL